MINLMKKYCLLIIAALFIISSAQAQCYEERHSTNWFDGWMSCEVAPNPNPAYENSHWIMYDLKGVFTINRSWFWNYNDVNNLGNGIQQAQVDFSMDGVSWTPGLTINLTQASGLPTYEGEAGPDFAGMDTRYILITGLQNHGGDCMALSEVRFEAEPKNVSTTTVLKDNSCINIDIFPNPVRTDTRVYFNSTCKGDMSYRIYDIAGRLMHSADIDAADRATGHIDLSLDNYASGEYILELIVGEESVKKQVILM